MTDTPKFKSILNLISSHNLDAMILKEIRSTNYYSYISEQHLVIISGNTRDKYAGVGVVIHPKIRSHLADVVQISNRIQSKFLIEFPFYPSLKKGIDIMGRYAPHSGLVLETIREPFWNKLEEILEKIPQPESLYIITLEISI